MNENISGKVVLDDHVYIQNVAKKTYIKLFLIGSMPILILFILSSIRGHNSSFFNLLIALSIINIVLLGGVKITFPKRAALKKENDKFYVYYKKTWFEIINPSEEIVFVHYYVKVKVDRKLLTVHLEEDELFKLKKMISERQTT